LRLGHVGWLTALLMVTVTGHAHGDDPPRPPAQVVRLARAELALSLGEVDQALAAFERAADQEHASDIELGLVRSQLQKGEYRRAMALAAHASGAHGDSVDGAVLYAWLLNMGGQGAVARQVLAEADRRVPGQALIAQAASQLQSQWPVARGALLTLPTRLAPYGPSDEALPSAARVVGSGVLIDQGRRALIPSDELRPAQAIWVRNGLGRLAKVEVERRLDQLGVAVVRLTPFLIPGTTGRRPARDPFPGSLAYTVEYAQTPDATAAWPMLRLGFLGMPDGGQGQCRLGIDVPPGPRGGPVLDAAGRLVGMAVGNHLVCLSQLIPLLGEVFGDTAEAPAPPRMPIDEVYEKALPMSLQVLSHAQ
jgi:hypothetical protein